MSEKLTRFADECERIANLSEAGERGEWGEGQGRPQDLDRAKKGRRKANSPFPDTPTADEKLAAATEALASDHRGTDAEYPTEALGPLADAARAIAEEAQVREALAGQSVLAVAALLAQEHHDVMTLGGPKPVSAFFLTVADSGDGKTTADTAAQHAVRERQREEAHRFRTDVDAYESAPRSGRPETPREPYRIMSDATVEGMRRGFVQGRRSQGAFSSEAAAILCGYGMSAEHRAKTAATLSGIWDSGELSVSRASSGRVQLYDRRLSVHWLIQPAAIEEMITDRVLTDMGFWPRFLVAWPEPAAPRSARTWNIKDNKRLNAFWERCEEMMDGAEREDCSGLPQLGLTDEATKLLGVFFERMERAAKGPAAQYADIKPFAIRASEQAARLAGVLASFGGMHEIDAGTIRNGIALTAYSLDTWDSIHGDREETQARALALTLFEWMLMRDGWSTSETAILRIGPKALRSASRRDKALAVLEGVGLAVRTKSIWSVK